MKPTSENTSRKKVLFLCSGNSCRSQMAEAIINNRMNQTWEAVSAGTRPSGFVHPKAIQVLAEIGIEHRGESKSVQDFKGRDFDLVVTVCEAAAEECPVWLGPGRRVHRGFVDPAKVKGSEAEVLEVFRRVRDEILEQIPVLLRE